MSTGISYLLTLSSGWESKKNVEKFLRIWEKYGRLKKEIPRHVPLFRMVPRGLLARPVLAVHWYHYVSPEGRYYLCLERRASDMNSLVRKPARPKLTCCYLNNIFDFGSATPEQWTHYSPVPTATVIHRNVLPCPAAGVKNSSHSNNLPVY